MLLLVQEIEESGGGKREPKQENVYLEGCVRGRGRYSKKNWAGVCGPLPKTLTLFLTKICDIPYSIYDLTIN